MRKGEGDWTSIGQANMDGMGFLDHEEGTQIGLHASQCNSE